MRDLARRMLVEVVNEPPGWDLVDLPGTSPMPLIPIGVTVAALAEAMQVHAANEPADRLREPWGAQVADYRTAVGPAFGWMPPLFCALRSWDRRSRVGRRRPRRGVWLPFSLAFGCGSAGVLELDLLGGGCSVRAGVSRR